MGTNIVQRTILGVYWWLSAQPSLKSLFYLSNMLVVQVFTVQAAIILIVTVFNFLQIQPIHQG
jgi:hypothetical protein